MKKLKKKKPPEGFVTWNQGTFDRLIESAPETLKPRMRITNSMVLAEVEQGGNAWRRVLTLIEDSLQTDEEKERLRARAAQIFATLIDAGVVVREELDENGEPVAASNPSDQTEAATAPAGAPEQDSDADTDADTEARPESGAANDAEVAAFLDGDASYYLTVDLAGRFRAGPAALPLHARRAGTARPGKREPTPWTSSPWRKPRLKTPSRSCVRKSARRATAP